jgi:hypothetical protein
VPPGGFPVATSQSTAVGSPRAWNQDFPDGVALEETSRLPSGEKARALTVVRWGGCGPSRSPVATSQTQTVGSPPPAARNLLSGEKQSVLAHAARPRLLGP